VVTLSRDEMTDPGTGQGSLEARALQEHHEEWALGEPLPAELALLAGEPDAVETLGGGTPAGPARAARVVKRNDERWAAVSYTAAVAGWLIVPLAVYLIAGRRSEFVRRHAGQAFRFTLTVTLFAVSGGIVAALLALNSPRYALIIMGPVMFVFWLVALWYLVRAARAARQGDFCPLPSWICVRTRR
jgi:uncharacterized Tic20 family protein